MDFKKKIKSRILRSILYIVIGIALIISYFISASKNDYLMAFGTAFAVLGCLQTVRYMSIARSEESIQERRIMENDERNIIISQKAKSMAFGWYIIIASVAVVTFSLMGKTEYANILEFNICALVLLYWISYMVYRKKL